MYLLFDIGGTNTRIAMSRDGISLGKTRTFFTSKDFSQALGQFKNVAGELTRGDKIRAAVGGARALDMRSRAQLISHPSFPLWVGQPLKEKLEEVLQTSVYLENDAALAGLGEAVFGAGKGFTIVVYLTLSTGIGGARIVDGKIDKNSLGFEPGNQIIDADVSLSPTVESPGYLERYISAEALKKRYGKDPDDLDDPRIWQKVEELLAIGLNNTIVHWSPDVVVLGGALMHDISLERVRVYLGKMLKVFPKLPQLVSAQLGDNRGLYGALAYIKETGA